MLRKLKLIGFALLSVAGLAPMGRAQAPASGPAKNCIGKANKAKVSAFVLLLRLRWDLYAQWKETGKWSDDTEANKALGAHSDYWTKQLKDGRAVLAGAMNGDYWDNAALIVFEAASLEEAETLAKNDPAVKAHVFQGQVRPFDMSWVTNKFTPGVEACAEEKAPQPK
jgi:uncharacterized protein YciI